MTAELPSLNQLRLTMTAVLPSPLSGITGDVTFVRTIYENGITHDAIAQAWNKSNKSMQFHHSSAKRSRVRPISLPTGLETNPIHRDSEHRISPLKGQNPFPGENPSGNLTEWRNHFECEP